MAARSPGRAPTPSRAISPSRASTRTSFPARSTPQDLAANAVTGPKIVDGSVGHGDLAPTALTAGFTQVVASTAQDTSTPKEVTVDCPAGKQVTGGGFVFGGSATTAGVVTPLRSYPLGANTWLVRAATISRTPSRNLTVDAICAS